MAKIKKVGYKISAKDETNVAIKSAKKRLKGLSSSAISAKSAFGALAGAMALRSVVNTIVEFEKLEASLVTVTGSAENASKAFDGIKEFAKKTPFQVADITRAFIQMKSLGLDPSEEALLSYSNTASAMGFSLNQMVEAVADATTGEFERLKAFGIKAKQQGDKVSLTFNNVTTTIQKDAASIEGYLRNIGNTKFAGAVDKQMATLGGSFSNLGDAAAQLASDVGKAGLSDAIKFLADTLTNDLMPILVNATQNWKIFLQGIDSIKDGKKLERIGELTESMEAMQKKITRLSRSRIISGKGGNFMTDFADFATGRTVEKSRARLQGFMDEMERMSQESQALTDSLSGADSGSGLAGKTPEEIAEEARVKEQIKLDALNLQAFENDIKNLERIDMFLLSEEDKLLQSSNRKFEMVQDAFDRDIISKSKKDSIFEKLEKKHQDSLTKLNKKGLTDRQKFQEMSSILQVKTVLGSLIQMTQGLAQNNKTMFEINKVSGIANAIINTAQGISKALATYPPPLNIAMAGITAAAGFAQIAAIKSTSYGGGGTAPSVSGSGGGGAGAPVNTIPASQPVAQIPTTTQDIKTTQEKQVKVFNVNITGNPTGEQVVDLLELFEDKSDDNVQFNVIQEAS